MNWKAILATAWLLGFATTAWGTYPAVVLVAQRDPIILVLSPWIEYGLYTLFLAAVAYASRWAWHTYLERPT